MRRRPRVRSSTPEAARGRRDEEAQPPFGEPAAAPTGPCTGDRDAYGDEQDATPEVVPGLNVAASNDSVYRMTVSADARHRVDATASAPRPYRVKPVIQWVIVLL